MKPMIWFFSLKHTGTHFTMEYLRRMGLAKARINVVTGVIQADGDYIHLHIEEPNHLPLVRYTEGPVFVTMRNPADVYYSWARRYGLAETTESALLKSFDEYQRIIDTLDPHIFRVDGDIESEVNALAEYLGVDYQYEFVDRWDHVGTRGQRRDYDITRHPTPTSMYALAHCYGYEPPIRSNHANRDVCKRHSV